MTTITEPARQTPVILATDVPVGSAGPGGLAGAQAARIGRDRAKVDRGAVQADPTRQGLRLQ